MPNSFPGGPGGEPDGRFGHETYLALAAWQRRVFSGQPNQGDGRAGPLTLARMDGLLMGSDSESASAPADDLSVSQCAMRVPAVFT